MKFQSHKYQIRKMVQSQKYQQQKSKEQPSNGKNNKNAHSHWAQRQNASKAIFSINKFHKSLRGPQSTKLRQTFWQHRKWRRTWRHENWVEHGNSGRGDGNWEGNLKQTSWEMAEEAEKELPLLFLLLLLLRSLTASNKLNQTRKYCQEQQQQQRGVNNNNNKYKEDDDEEEEEGSQCANFQDEANFACFEIQF